jgi:signal transduction histidine kinase
VSGLPETLRFSCLFDLPGNELVNPGFPKPEGTNVLELQNKTGKYLNRTLISLLQKQYFERQHFGWVDYYFPKPGADRIAKIWAYIKRVDIQGTAAGVGAGIYLD